MTEARGFGIAGALDRALIRELADEAEAAGFRSFWANDTPGGDGLEALATAAAATSQIDLGVGVIPVDRSGPARIATRIRELALPEDRLILGIGSGGAKTGTVELVEAAIGELRGLTSARIVVGALGPRMCRLAGRTADGVLLNWLTPAATVESAALVREAARDAGRPAPLIAAYVRTALPAGWAKVEDESARYGSFPQYARHFQRMGVAPVETTVVGDGTAIVAGFGAFDAAADEVIARAIVDVETLDAYRAVLRAVAHGA